MLSEHDFRWKAINGVKWTAVERFGTQILLFVVGIIIARLVTPADYGIVGMLAIFIDLGTAMLESGFGTALIRQKERTSEDYATAFLFNIAVGVFVYLCLYIAAPFIAAFYAIPVLKPVTRIYGLTLLVNALTVVQAAKLTAELRFRAQCIINLGGGILSGVVGIAMAYYGYGVWAIVWQFLLNRMVCLILLWIVSHWLPRLCFSRQSFKRLFGFGSKMLGLSFIDIIYDNIYAFIIGKIYQPQFVGYYTRSQRIVAIPQNSIAQIVSKVCLPVLSPYQDDNMRLIDAYENIFRLAIFTAYPLITGLFVLAHPLVLLLLGEKWLPCVPYLQILSFGALWVVLTLINLNLFVVKGRSDLLLKLGIIKKVIGFVIVAITVRFGMYWICFGTTLYALFAFIINSMQSKRLLGYGIVAQLLVAFPVCAKSFVMGCAVFIVTKIITEPLLQVVVGVPLGMCVYFGLGFLVQDKSHCAFMEIVRKKR